MKMYYDCPCGTSWETRWECACNDRCPACDREIEPTEIEDEDEE